MKRKNLLLGVLLLMGCSSSEYKLDNLSLLDGALETFAIGTKGINVVEISYPQSTTINNYQLFCGGSSIESDALSLCLKASNDGDNWEIIDNVDSIKFSSRYQGVRFILDKQVSYKNFKFEIKSNGDSLILSEIKLENIEGIKEWENFKYPKINFIDKAPQSEGSKIYHSQINDIDNYIKYHALEVAKILFYSPSDSMYNVEQINYTLEDYDGVSAKGGAPPVISIVYSTQHIEKSAKESTLLLDWETRGVLFHELTHAYQHEPNGIGNYSNNKIFWACIEGLADAVRAQAGFFDIENDRKPGGNWLDGYRTTGYFIQWLTTKDVNAIRKFHESVRDLDVWSFDGAMKYIFGEQATIEAVWDEYQSAISK